MLQFMYCLILRIINISMCDCVCECKCECSINSTYTSGKVIRITVCVTKIWCANLSHHGAYIEQLDHHLKPWYYGT